MAKNDNAANDLLKVIGEDVMNQVEIASANLKGDSFETVEAALKAAGAEDPFFNPTLSQYREGLCINTYRDVAKIRRVPVGNNATRKAWCITCPAGYKKDNKIVYSQAFNFYPSTLRKLIQVTDEMGDQVLDENKEPVTVDGKGNPTWDAARAIDNPEDLLEFALDKVYETSEIKRDFGPSVFVDQKDGTRKATSHKLTSVPLFNIIG